MKYTDAEIEKALKCCADKKRCHDCPFCVTSREPCYITLAREAASLLARREAKIDLYRKDQKETLEKVTRVEKLLPLAIASTRAKAIKEFAERLKNCIHEDMPSICDRAGYIAEDLPDSIDNLVKEMTEGENGSIQQETAEADSTGGSYGGNDRLRGTL